MPVITETPSDKNHQVFSLLALSLKTQRKRDSLSTTVGYK